VTQNLKLGVWEGRLWAQGNPKSVVGEASVSTRDSFARVERLLACNERGLEGTTGVRIGGWSQQ
jgi:hypothetical protein